jgi:hypothetical protein
MVEKNRKGMSLLGEILERRMLLYVMAAGSALAAVPAAQGRVVFTSSNTVYHGHTITIDLNNDGVTDFNFFVIGTGGCGTESRGYCNFFMEMRGAAASNLVEMGPDGGQAALIKGAKIGSGNDFSDKGDMVAFLSEPSGQFLTGSWLNVTNRFLGVKFIIGGQVHYGWIGFRGVSGIERAAFAGWAYETTPNKPIAAGDRGLADSATLRQPVPTSLQLLAMGHTGIADRQRRIAGTV